MTQSYLGFIIILTVAITAVVLFARTVARKPYSTEDYQLPLLESIKDTSVKTVANGAKAPRGTPKTNSKRASRPSKELIK